MIYIFDFKGQAGRGNNEEFGLLSLEFDENFCMGGPGIIMSRQTLKRGESATMFFEVKLIKLRFNVNSSCAAHTDMPEKSLQRSRGR